MHKSTERLYEALKSLNLISGRHPQAEVASLLGVSAQMVNNWEARGISKAGLLECQTRFGISATWIELGATPVPLKNGCSNADSAWRFDVLREWLKDNKAPSHEKSLFSQLKKGEGSFGEKLAHRLGNEYGIEGLISHPIANNVPSGSLTALEMSLLESFSKLKDVSSQRQAIGYIEWLAKFMNNNKIY